MVLTKDGAKMNLFTNILSPNLLIATEIVSPKNSGYMSMVLELELNSKTKQDQDPEGTIKFMFVIAGEITVVVEELERTLSKGDSVQINSHRPHHFENRTKKNALAILYQNPKRF